MESRRRKRSFLRPAPSSNAPPNSSRVFCDPSSDTSRRKKVKFADSATMLETTSEHDLPSFQTQKPHDLNIDDPKTSEYKFFREIQGKTTGNHQNLQLPMENIHTKASQQKDVMQEINSSSTSKHDFRSSFILDGTIIPIADRFSISPPKIPGEHEFRSSVKSKNNMSRSLLPISDVTLAVQISPLSPDNISWNYASEFENSGIFSKKRSKLLQLVAESFSLGKEKLELSRLELISELLQRLGTERKSNLQYEVQYEEFPEPGQNMPCGRTQSPASCNSSFFEIENKVGTELIESTTTEHLQKQLPYHKCSRDYDDELRLPSWDYANFQAFPNWPAQEDGLLHKSLSNLELLKAENLELHDDEISPSIIQWNSDFKYSNHGSHEMGDMSIKTDYQNSNNASCCYSTGKSLVPYTKSKFLKLFDPQSPGEQSVFPLLEWKETTKELELGLASDRLVPAEIDQFSLNLFGASRLLGETKSGYGRGDIFDSLLIDNCKMMLQDASGHCPGIFFPSTAERARELNWKSLSSDFVREYHLSNHMERQIYKDVIAGRSTFMSPRSSFDGGVDEEASLEAQVTCLAAPTFGSPGL